MVKIIKKESLKSKKDSASSHESKASISSERSRKTLDARINNFETISLDLLGKGYTQHKAIISVKKANILAIFVSAPFLFLALLFFYLSQGELNFTFGTNFGGTFLFFILSFASIFIHEFLHGFGWSLYCNYRWKSIEFGVIWKYLTPYCHCKELLPTMQYLSGGLLPFMVLGVLLNQLSVWTGSYLLLALSLFNILAAGGDLAIALMLISYRKANTRILDHPTECGFVAFVKE
jgi:hypothetical protein